MRTKFAMLVVAALLQHSTALAQRLEFEVASVKPKSDNSPINFSAALCPERSGDLIRFHNTLPYSVVFYAYHLKGNYEMVGFPASQGGSSYNIEARAGANATDDQ